MSRRTDWRGVEQEHYDTLVAETGESWWGHQTPAGRMRLQRRARTLAELLPRGGADVLEVGCGTGSLTIELLKSIPDIRLTATDMSAASVQRTQNKCAAFPRLVVQAEDLTRLSFADGTFDAVVGNSILHHCPTESALRESYRVLRPGGFLLMFEPNLANPQLAFDHMLSRVSTRHARRMQITPNEKPLLRWPLQKMLVNVGFVAGLVEPMDFLHPSVPERYATLVDRIGQTVERLPGLREISGSLLIIGRKAGGTLAPQSQAQTASSSPSSSSTLKSASDSTIESGR